MTDMNDATILQLATPSRPGQPKKFQEGTRIWGNIHYCVYSPIPERQEVLFLQRTAVIHKSI